MGEGGALFQLFGVEVYSISRVLQRVGIRDHPRRIFEKGSRAVGESVVGSYDCDDLMTPVGITSAMRLPRTIFVLVEQFTRTPLIRLPLLATPGSR